MNEAARDVIKAVCEATGWSPTEAMSFVGCLRADTPEDLIERAIPEAIEIARQIESAAALVATMKSAGTFLEVTVENGEMVARVDPERMPVAGNA